MDNTNAFFPTRLRGIAGSRQAERDRPNEFACGRGGRVFRQCRWGGGVMTVMSVSRAEMPGMPIVKIAISSTILIFI